MRILVTGGAGFIGSHLVSYLVEEGHNVRVLDDLVQQVHGANPQWPNHLPDNIERQRGNVTDSEAWRQALVGVEAVYHLAAEVGVGQSMYEIVRYMSANTLGTSILLELLASGQYPIRKLIVASSMSIYGEGAYHCATCGSVTPPLRSLEQLERHRWEMACPNCHAELRPIPTPETKPLQPTSVYAISKRDQEELCLSVGQAYSIPTVALRFFNVYGPGQSLSNPYTGVAAIFLSRLLNHKSPLVYEDGRQSRDFVHVSDIVQALQLALRCEAANYEAFNIGSGEPRTVLDIAGTLAQALGVEIAPQIVTKYRQGDIRHCYADIEKARRTLGYTPRAAFADKVRELAEWVQNQTAIDLVDLAKAELERRGLTR